MKEKFMKKAISESLKSLATNDIPVGTIIIKNNQIVARAYNSCKKNNTIHDHAEIIALNKAIKKLNNNVQIHTSDLEIIPKTMFNNLMKEIISNSCDVIKMIVNVLMKD